MFWNASENGIQKGNACTRALCKVIFPPSKKLQQPQIEQTESKSEKIYIFKLKK